MRILSLAPSNTEIVAALGAAHLLVGATRYCDWPLDLQDLPRIGGWTDVDDTLVAALAPDLILTSTFVQGEAEARYAALGLRVLHVDPRDLTGVCDSFRRIGEALGRPEAAAALVDSFAEGLDLPFPRARRRVYVEEWHHPPTPAGNWVPQLITLAGGLCTLIPPGEASHPVPESTITAFNPEVIVLSLCGIGVQAKPELVGRRPGWEGLPAVQHGRVHVIDDSLLNRPGPRLIQGLRRLRELISA